MHTDPVTNQTAFRFRNDDGSETAATWKAALNTNVSLSPGDTFRIRIQMSETAGSSYDFTTSLQCSVNGGTWNNIGVSTAILGTNSTHYASNDTTTEQLAGPRTFTAGRMVEGSGSHLAVTLSNRDTEIERCCQVNSSFGLVNGDTIDLRYIDALNGVYTTYSQVPRITITGASSNRTITSAALNIPKQTLSGTIDAEVPVYTVTSAALAIPKQTLSGTIDYDQDRDITSAALNIPKQTLSGTIDAEVPVYSITAGTLNIPMQSFSGTMDETGPLFSITSAALNIPMQTFSGTIDETGPVYSITAGTLSIPMQDLSGTALAGYPEVMFAESFNWYSTPNDQPLGKWASQTETVGSMSSTTPFTDGQSLSIGSTGANTIYRTPVLGTASSAMYVQLRHRNNDWPNSGDWFTTLGFELSTGSDWVSRLQWGSSVAGTAQSRVVRGNTTTVIATDTDAFSTAAWFNFEYRVEITNSSDGTGDLDTWIDEVQGHDLNATDLTNGDVTMDRFYVNFDIAETTALEFWDDILVTKGGRLPQSRIVSSAANADTAQTDFTPSSGTTQWEAVDQLPTNPAGTYISSSTVGHKTRVGVGVPGTEPLATLAVQPHAAVLATTSGTARINLRVGSTTATGSTFTLTTGLRVFAPNIYNLNPATGAPWQWSDLAGVEVEIEVVTVSGEIRVFSLGVDYIVTEEPADANRTINAGALTIPMQTLSGTIDYNIIFDISAGDLTIPMQDLSGTIDAEVPVFTVTSGTLNIPMQSFSGTMTFGVNEFSITSAALAIPMQELTGTMTNQVPVFDITSAALSIPMQTLSGEMQSVEALYQITAATLNIPMQDLSGTVDHEPPPSRTITSGDLSIPKQALLGFINTQLKTVELRSSTRTGFDTTNIYTASSGTTGIMLNLRLANVTDVGAYYSITVAGKLVVENAPLPANAADNPFISLSPVLVNADEQVIITSYPAGAIDAHLSYAQRTN